MSKKYGDVIRLLENWRLYSKRTNEKDEENLRILLSGLKTLTEVERNLLWNVYYLEKTTHKDLTNNNSISLSEFNKKHVVILGKMEKAVEDVIEKERKLTEDLIREAKFYLLRFQILRATDIRDRIKVLTELEKYPWLPENPIDRILLGGGTMRDRIEILSEYVEHLSKVKNPIDKIILRGRYSMNKSWDEIGHIIGLSGKQISRKEEHALIEFGKVLRQEREGYQDE